MNNGPVSCADCMYHVPPTLPKDPGLPGTAAPILRLGLEWKAKMREIAEAEQEFLRSGEKFMSTEPRTLVWCRRFSYEATEAITGANVLQHALCAAFNSDRECAEFVSQNG